MKKISFVLILTLFSLVACDPLKGHRGISCTIEQSKEIETFIKEFVIISDTNDLKGVNKIWAEYSWNHAGWFEKEKIRKEANTCIFEFKSSQYLNKYDTTWAIRENIPKYESYNCGSNRNYHLIYCEVGNYLRDTIHFTLVKGNLLENKIEFNKEIILVAKKH